MGVIGLNKYFKTVTLRTLSVRILRTRVGQTFICVHIRIYGGIHIVYVD